MKLAEFVLSRAGNSDVDQARLFRAARDLHKAIASSDHFQSNDVVRVLNKSADNYEQTVKQAHMAVGMILRKRGWPEESEKHIAKVIANAFGVPVPKVIGLKDTVRRKNFKYPLLRNQFLTALRDAEGAYPGQPRQQYEAWRQCAVAEWKAKI
jgi:hypothetical protein